MKNLVMIAAALIISSPLAFGAAKNGKAGKIDKCSWMNMTPETRTQMADMHQKMADCLKSEKPIDECREKMMADCPMGKDGTCPMMGMMMKHGAHDCMMHH